MISEQERYVVSQPRIVIINLLASATRRQQIAVHLAELGLRGEFFVATDGRRLSEAEIADVYDEQGAERTEWGKLTRGEIGCALSHRAVWQALVDSGESGWLVMEDDAVLAPDVPKWLGQLPGIARDGDVVALVPTSPTPYCFRQVKLGPRRVVYPNQAFVTATAYYITPLAASRLIQASLPITFPIDCWYSSPGFKGVTTIRAIWPAAVRPSDETLDASTIGVRQAHLRIGVSAKKSWLREKVSHFRRYLKNTFFNTPIRFD